MKHLILFIIFLQPYLLTFSQIHLNIDSVNQKNEKGKKHGIWIEYLSDGLKKVKRKKAHYYRYTCYYNGKNIDPMGYTAVNDSVQIKGNKPIKKGNPVLLDGNYKFFYKNGNIMMNLSFKNGFRKGQVYYFYRLGGKEAIIDYEKKYKGQLFSYYMKAYRSNGKLISEGYWRKKEGEGWSFLEIKKTTNK